MYGLKPLSSSEIKWRCGYLLLNGVVCGMGSMTRQGAQEHAEEHDDGPAPIERAR